MQTDCDVWQPSVLASSSRPCISCIHSFITLLATAMFTLQADNLTVFLLFSCIGLFFCHLLFLRPGSPTAHPILLGRAGESAKVRNKGESAVWTNALAASGLLVASSQSSIKGIKHIVDLDKKAEVLSLARKLKSVLGNASRDSPATVAIVLKDDACE